MAADKYYLARGSILKFLGQTCAAELLKYMMNKCPKKLCGRAAAIFPGHQASDC